MARQDGVDPYRSLTMACAIPLFDDRQVVLTSLFQKWIKTDAEGAKTAVLGLQGWRGGHARTVLAQVLADQDIKSAWEWVCCLPKDAGEGYSDPCTTVAEKWAHLDPQAALLAAQTLPTPEKQRLVMASVIRVWAETDFTAALEYACDLTDSSARGCALLYLSSEGKGHYEEYFHAVMKNAPPGDHFQQSVTHMFRWWASEDPLEASKAVMQLPHGSKVFSDAVTETIRGWTSYGADHKAFDWVRALPEGEARTSGLHSLFSSWADSDPQAAMRGLDQLPKDQRKKYFSQIVGGWSEAAPQAVLQWAASLSDLSERGAAIDSAIGQWIKTSPQEAWTYVMQLPEGERHERINCFIGSWVHTDADAASQWLEQQPAGLVKDTGLKSLAQLVSDEDPEASMAWAARMQDQKERWQTMEWVGGIWMRRDPVAARRWISTSNLPEKTRKELLQ
jgi:hypothetical protein